MFIIQHSSEILLVYHSRRVVDLNEEREKEKVCGCYDSIQKSPNCSKYAV